MYEQFFGLDDEPFRLTPDPQYLYLTAKHAEALAHLRLGLTESSGFVCITGDVGTGKTTLLRTFLAELGPDVSAAYTLVPPLSALELLRRICRDFGLPASSAEPGELLDELHGFLREQNEAGRVCVVVLDEAQALSVELLEQIRLLLNLETETQKLLRIILVGQPQLRRLLLDPDLAQLNQRITLRWHLGPLTYRETAQYVRHRLGVASHGRAIRLFTTPALRLLHSVSNGVPRVVNMVAHRALLVAFVTKQRKITRRVVMHAYREIQALPLPGTLTMARKAALAVSGVAIGATAVVFGAPQLDRLQTVLSPVASEERIDEPRASAAVADTKPALVEMAAVPALATPTPLPEPTRPPAEPEPAPPAAARVSEEVTASAPEVSVAPSGAERIVSEADLAARVAGLAADASIRAAASALLLTWGASELNADETDVLDDLESIGWRRGLQHLSLSANSSMLRLLDLPALIPLQIADVGVRHVALTGLDGAGAVVSIDGAAVQVDAALLDRLWSGEAEVFWKDFEGLGPTMGAGARGTGVVHLQETLRKVGVFNARTTGVFDAATDDAVRRFQRSQRLEIDGLVGPFTRIALYAAVGGYERPSLAMPSPEERS